VVRMTTIEQDFDLVAAALDSYVRFVNRRASGVNGPFQLDDVKAALSRINAEIRRLENLHDFLWAEMPRDKEEA